MATHFLDTSALAKRYVVEMGSSWVTALTDPGSGQSCWISAMAAVELVAAFYRRTRVGTLTLEQAQQAEALFRAEQPVLFPALAVSASTLGTAMRLVGIYSLRAYDAVQLATALELRELCRTFRISEPVFLSADQALNGAGAAEGLVVDDPNTHP